MNSELLLGLYVLVFPYIFLLFDCLKMVLIDCIVKCKVHSVLWQLPGGVNLQIYPGKSDCFELALIDRIVKCKVHSVLWQLEVGGGVNLKI